MRETVFDYYTALHKIPEPALQEVQTSAYLAEKLRAMGVKVEEGIGGTTAVLGVIPAQKPGPVVMLRADMDAMPYTDPLGKPYAQHTCGHDAHASMVLACGQAIQEEGGLPAGELRLLFQPAEENMEGAKAVIAAGAVDDVDALVGIHLRPAEEAPLHCATPALCHGACGTLTLGIRGKSAHGARPHLGVNAIDAAALAVHAVNAIHLAPDLPYSIKATKIASQGDAHNCIPERVDLCFDLRCQTNQGMQMLLEKAKAAIASAAGAVGASCEDWRETQSAAAEYDPRLVELARESIVQVLGKAMPPIFTVGGEDFHFYHTLAGRRTVYIGLGAGMTGGLHSTGMTFDLAALEDGVSILTALARKISEGGV